MVWFWEALWPLLWWDIWLSVGFISFVQVIGWLSVCMWETQGFKSVTTECDEPFRHQPASCAGRRSAECFPTQCCTRMTGDKRGVKPKAGRETHHCTTFHTHHQLKIDVRSSEEPHTKIYAAIQIHWSVNRDFITVCCNNINSLANYITYSSNWEWLIEPRGLSGTKQ